MTSYTTDQERAEFNAWWEEHGLGDYRSQFEAWQAARRTQALPDAYLVYAKGSTRYWVVTLNPDDVPEIYKGGETVPLYRNAAIPTYRLDYLLAGITAENRHAEQDLGMPQGQKLL